MRLSLNQVRITTKKRLDEFAQRCREKTKSTRQTLNPTRFVLLHLNPKEMNSIKIIGPVLHTKKIEIRNRMSKYRKMNLNEPMSMLIER